MQRGQFLIGLTCTIYAVIGAYLYGARVKSSLQIWDYEFIVFYAPAIVSVGVNAFIRFKMSRMDPVEDLAWNLARSVGLGILATSLACVIYVTVVFGWWGT